MIKYQAMKRFTRILLLTLGIFLHNSIHAQCDSCDVSVTGGINLLCDSTQLDWVTWGTVTADTAVGTISNNISITITMSTGGLGTTPTMFNGSYFPLQYGVPVNTTCLLNSNAGIFTVCYSVPVRDPQIAFASIGNPNVTVPITTSACYEVIWAGLEMTYDNDTTMTGTEGYTIIKFPGTHTCITFDYEIGEYYCNLAFGILDTNCQIIAPPPGCSGDSLNDTLYATGANTYSWTPSTGLNTTTGPVVIANPTVTTTYYVTGTCINGGHSIDSITVPVYGLPNASISGADSLCNGGQTTLSVGNFSSYNWSTGATTESINVTGTGEYYVTVTNSNGCSSKDSINVHQYSIPPPVISGQDSICNGASTTLNTGSYTSFIWNNGSTNQSTTIISAGTYTVTVTDINGCSATASKTITLLSGAQAAFNTGQLIGCDSVTVSFNNTSSNATSYYWNFGDGSNSSSTSPSHTYRTSGNFFVTLIGYAPNGCNDTVIQQITLNIVNDTVASSFIADTIHGCSPFTVNFTNTSYHGTSYFWSFGDGFTSTSTSPSHTYQDSGTYTVTLIAYNLSSPCPMTSDTMKIQNYIRVDTTLNTVATFAAEPLDGCAPLLVNFKNNSTNSTSYTWNYGDGWYDTIMNPTHLYIDSGTYIITLAANNPGNNCGRNSDSVLLDIHVDSCEIYFPNVFSPNGDGKNDFFSMIAFGFKNYHLLIFNRWGLKVFESSDADLLWNGKMNNTGSECSDGTYYYIFTGNDMSDKPYSQHGYLTLIR